MWVPKDVISWFNISKDSVDALRVENAKLNAENVSLRQQVTTTTANFDWIRGRVNQLEMERAQLIKKAYNIDLPVPEIARAQSNVFNFDASLFDDMGDEKAKELGLPIYGK